MSNKSFQFDRPSGIAGEFTDGEERRYYGDSGTWYVWEVSGSEVRANLPGDTWRRVDTTEANLIRSNRTRLRATKRADARAEAEAMREAASGPKVRYYAGATTLFRFNEAGGVVRNSQAEEWRVAQVNEKYVSTLSFYRLLSATDDASAIREAWPEPKPASVPAPDPAVKWAESSVTRKEHSDPEWLHVEAGFDSAYVIMPACGNGFALDRMRRLIAAAFRAGVAHERARVEGLCERLWSGDTYTARMLLADIRSGRDLRTEAK